MSMVKKFDPKELDAAGRVLANVPKEGEDDSEWIEAFELVSGWRAVHAGPLRTFRRNLGRRVGRRGIVAQRLKRMPTIISKLERLPWLKLSRMQDVGGCRAIVASADDAFRLAGGLADSKIRHERLDYKNYIDDPRRSGYRGLHLVYGYASESRPELRGLKIELQIRSQLQHQWATAVETVGTFIGDELKSSQGDETWLRFFALMSSVIAHREHAPLVPGSPEDHSSLVAEIKDCAGQSGILERLTTFESATHLVTDFPSFRDRLIVMRLDLRNNRVEGMAFKDHETERATATYAEEELSHRDDPRIAVVMVSAKSVQTLRRAYPNFFADLTGFRKLVSETIA